MISPGAMKNTEHLIYLLFTVVVCQLIFQL